MIYFKIYILTRNITTVIPKSILLGSNGRYLEIHTFKLPTVLEDIIIGRYKIKLFEKI